MYSQNETLNLLRHTVEQFAKKEIAPIAAEIDIKNEFPSICGKRWANWDY